MILHSHTSLIVVNVTQEELLEGMRTRVGVCVCVRVGGGYVLEVVEIL